MHTEPQPLSDVLVKELIDLSHFPCLKSEKGPWGLEVRRTGQGAILDCSGPTVCTWRLSRQLPSGHDRGWKHGGSGDSDAELEVLLSGGLGSAATARHRQRVQDVCVPAPNSVPSSSGKAAIQVGCISISSPCEQKHPWWSPGLAPFAGRGAPQNQVHRVSSCLPAPPPPLSPVFTGAAHKSPACANGPWPVSL